MPQGRETHKGEGVLFRTKKEIGGGGIVDAIYIHRSSSGTGGGDTPNPQSADSRLTLGSLFDGSGGFPLGGLLAGIKPLWASEIEPFPIRVTTKRLPSVEHLGDISTVDGAKVAPVDIITFG